MKKRYPLLLSAALVGGVWVSPAAAQEIADNAVVRTAPGAVVARVLSSDSLGAGRIVEVFGDLATARHVAVLVPGVSWTGPLIADETAATRRHPAVQARALLARMQQDDPAHGSAVVVWLDYDPPQDLGVAAARSDRAVAGAPRLARFVATLPRTAGVTLVCHSYGSVVCGHAAPDLHRVSDIVAIGSPGMDVEHRADLGTTARVWAGRAEGDPIGLVPYTRFGDLGHGADPTAPAFGALPLPVDGAYGHNDYLAPGTASLAAMARIAVGQPGVVAGSASGA
ncbi:alpha/beta hydrolase [Pedococcus sp. NPDC057267]|uniref:alpha/beta hydrolase n=1 Tax=Pedococcus sp. NPDC057267 TaxID=3346077 RepID=UPI003631507F